jgi:transposase-like protein
LTIIVDELGEGYCPECFEIDGKRRYEFEEIKAEERNTARYRCEDCGAVIESK